MQKDFKNEHIDNFLSMHDENIIEVLFKEDEAVFICKHLSANIINYLVDIKFEYNYSKLDIDKKNNVAVLKI